ncbi:MAG: acyltransferase family protein [Actinobacteria bacterium]|nr:acyltransferase family protein [Actinomycetota bacterium]
MPRPGIPHQPALDGVRAASVLAVLLFHGEITGFDGGYLGVSVFFTLSGYLITSLLIVEREGTGHTGVGAFYVRRAKRLLPASVLCLTAIAVLAATTDWFAGVSTLRRDLLGALFQVANWVSLGGSGSYQQLFADAAGQASPVEHYWSLAIEEQFYWLWPLAFVGLYRLARSHRSRTLVVGLVTVGFGVAAPVVAAVWGADAAYWATPARAAEILTGAFVAFALHGRSPARWWAWLASAASVALIAAVLWFPSVGGPAYHGALPLVGVTSAILVVGLQAPGPVRTFLSTRPLVWLGRISYGVYLFHWPVFVVLDDRRVDLPNSTLFLVRLAVTLVLAQLSFMLIERPIRTGVTWRPPTVGATALAGCLAVAVATVALVPGGDADYWQRPAAVEAAGIEPADGDDLAPLVAASTSVAPTTPAATTSPATSGPSAVDEPATSLAADTTSTSTTTTLAPLPELSRPMRVLVAGDSTAEATGFGLAQWAAEQPELAQVSLVVEEGCGFLRGGEQLIEQWVPVPDRCDQWLTDELPGQVDELRPDVVMLMTTSWDVLDRRWDGGPDQSPLDAGYAQRVATDFAAITASLLEAGATEVVWVREPIPNVFWWSSGQAQEDPARHAVLYGVMDDVAASSAGRVTVVDLPAWVAQHGMADDHEARPDGVHWSPEAAARIAREFLGEQLIRAALAAASG